MFSESGSVWPQGAPRREWLVLSKRCNAADERFPARPKGTPEMIQYGVAVLGRDPPFPSDRALSCIIWVVLNMTILP